MKNPMSSSVHIIYASTSGHTEYVVEQLMSYLQEKAPEMLIEKKQAESAKKEDFQKSDILILGSGTWNYGGIEGQLNTHMHRLLFEECKGIDLAGKHIACISLGDDRYHYTVRCTEHFMYFLKTSHARMLLVPLIMVNEPYGQEERIRKWGDKLILSVQKIAHPSPPSVPAA